MRNEDKKAATAAYKETKPAAGVYAFRCEPTRTIWVGRAPDLAKIENRLRFTLRQDSHPRRSLQAEWNAHGPDAFQFEALEELENEEIAYVLDRVLNERLAFWQEKLGANLI